jgi:hypothetical protein
MTERDNHLYGRLSEAVTGALLIASVTVILAICFT